MNLGNVQKKKNYLAHNFREWDSKQHGANAHEGLSGYVKSWWMTSWQGYKWDGSYGKTENQRVKIIHHNYTFFWILFGGEVLWGLNR